MIPNQQSRHYWHRFTPIGTKDLHFKRLSKPFFLHDRQIEFVAGACLHPGHSDTVVFSYGVKALRGSHRHRLGQGREETHVVQLMKRAKDTHSHGLPCPIPGHPRPPPPSTASCSRWYKELRDRGAEITPIFSKPEQLWLLRLLLTQQTERALTNKQVKWAEYDNPAKNTLLYHCVNHQKFQWLLEAYNADGADLSPYDTYVWMDFGIRRILSGEATNAARWTLSTGSSVTTWPYPDAGHRQK